MSVRTAEKTFYDEHPFDWTERYAPEELAEVISAVLRREVEAVESGAVVLDVGCGPGRVMAWLARLDVRAVGLDRSARSVALMRNRCAAPGVVADNLALPARTGCAAMAISDGVLHHTAAPRTAFAELCRVLRPGGRLYLAVYKPGGRYQFLYRFPGVGIRWAVRRAATRWLVHATALPLYFAVHWVRSRGRRSWRGARNLFYDYFVSPRVDFLSRETIERWSREEGLDLLNYDANPEGNVHAFVLRKSEAR